MGWADNLKVRGQTKNDFLSYIHHMLEFIFICCMQHFFDKDYVFQCENVH